MEEKEFYCEYDECFYEPVEGSKIGLCVTTSVTKDFRTVTIDGIEHKADVYVKSDRPYLDSLKIRQEESGKCYTSGSNNLFISGLDLEAARQLLKELPAAIRLLEQRLDEYGKLK